MHAWSAVPGSSGAIQNVEIIAPASNAQLERDLIVVWASKIEKKPWRWTFGERSRIGFFLPEFRKSKKVFQKMGFDITRKSKWPQPKIEAEQRLKNAAILEDE